MASAGPVAARLKGLVVPDLQLRVRLLVLALEVAGLGLLTAVTSKVTVIWFVMVLGVVSTGADDLGSGREVKVPGALITCVSARMNWFPASSATVKLGPVRVVDVRVQAREGDGAVHRDVDVLNGEGALFAGQPVQRDPLVRISHGGLDPRRC